MAKHMMSKEKNVDTYVRSLKPGKRALVQTLRRLVKKQAPHLVEVMKWGSVCWIGNGNVCLVHVEDDHLDFGFFYGTALPDPEGASSSATGSFSEWSRSARRRTFGHESSQESRQCGFVRPRKQEGLMSARVLIASILLVLAQGGSSRPDAASPLVIGETFLIDSRAVGETRRVNIYLPPGYTDAATTRFPVLYVPDGGMAEDFLHVAGLVQVSVGNGTMRPFVLVGIENTQRRRDLTGPTRDDEDRKIAPKVGGSAAFRTFIRTELMPAVASRYRTTAETAIMGESLAGLFVVETFLLEPDLFDTYIAFDPSLWWNRSDLVTTAARRLSALGSRQKTLYLSNSGEEELAQLTLELARQLQKGAPPSLKLHYEPMPNETHATIYHPAGLAALRRLFRPPAP